MNHVPDAASLWAQGLTGDSRAFASVTDRLGMPGGADHARILHARVMGGFDFDVLPARGFDIGDVSYCGIPLSWFSPIHDARPLSAPSGNQWGSRFNGGLLTTCGLSSIGPAPAGGSMHGDFSHLPASNVRFDSGVTEAGGAVRLQASVESITLFDSSFRVDRTIESSLVPGSRSPSAALTVRDTVTNIGRSAAPLAMLYHANLGAPLVVPGIEIATSATSFTEREPDPSHQPETMPDVTDESTESVFELHDVAVDDTGFTSVTVRNPAAELSLEIRYSTATLPRLFQWVFPTRGRWALGIEPATAPLFGPNLLTEHRGAPLVERGPHANMRSCSSSPTARTAELWQPRARQITRSLTCRALSP